MTELPPLNGLRAFDAVVRHGSISRAATALGVTHGAISQQIRLLEEAVGQQLFNRDGRRLQLTPHAREFAPAISEAFETIRTAADRLHQGTEGRLRITCAPGLLSHWLLPALPDFTARHPSTTLSIAPANDLTAIRAASADLAIIHGNPPGDLWSRPIGVVRLFPILSPGLLQRTALRSARDLADCVLLHGDQEQEWRAWFDAAGQPFGERRGHYFPDARLALEAAVQGLGVALGDDITAANALGEGRLIRPLALSIPASGGFHLVCAHERRADRLVATAIQWISQRAQTLQGTA